MPELDLLQMDLDEPTMVIGLDSLNGSAGLTPEKSQRSGASLQDFGGALMMPPSASSFPGGPVGAGGNMSVRGDFGAGTRIENGLFQQDEATGLLEDDLGMQIDADGNFVLDDDIPTAAVRQPRAPSGRVDRTELPSDAASARVRGEHEGGQAVGDFVSEVFSFFHLKVASADS